MNALSDTLTTSWLFHQLYSRKIGKAHPVMAFPKQRRIFFSSSVIIPVLTQPETL
ncbi:hypothetical protein LC724_13670 [Blautia sp. RD014234]|nr:hypothetical protein [Blautia parvula]